MLPVLARSSTGTVPVLVQHGSTVPVPVSLHTTRSRSSTSTVLVRYSCTGTGTGTILEVPVSGKSYTVVLTVLASSNQV
jgi:hypothetical protein